MRVGPMPIHAADKLLRTLKKHGLEGELQVSGEVFSPEEQKTAHPRTESPADLVYVDFEDSALDLLRPDLIRLALLDESVSTGTELDGTDWLCPRCGKTFEHPGQCPTHALPLVTFEEYVAAKKIESNKIEPLTMIIFAAIGAGIIYMMTR